MFQIEVNKELLPIKLNYFFHFGSIGPIMGFLPTIVKQLGYSITTYGTTMMFITTISFLLAPSVGIIVDKFRVKRVLFLTAIAGLGLVSFSFLFIPKVPLNTSVELKCDTNMVITVNSEYIQQNSPKKMMFMEKNIDELIKCKLNCQDTHFYNHEQNNHSDLSSKWMSTISNIENVDSLHEIEVTFKLKDTEQIENLFIFHPLVVLINGTQMLQTTCQWNLKTFCRINCSREILTNITTVTTYRGNVLKLYQFWVLCILVCTFYICATTIITLQNPICLDNLGDKTEDFGKQKCWASAGWGFLSIFIGWLVDFISVNKKEKDYSPVFYSSIILTTMNLLFSNKIKVLETQNTKGKTKSIYDIFKRPYVIAFFSWIAINSLLHAIITHFLFWYMDDMVAVNNDDYQRSRIKTLQGLAQGIQCFGGEIPFLFCSGWMIKKLGHINCMAVVLGAMAVRMFLYTVISNPAWIILIELLNGISYALGYAVRISYAKSISLPDTTFTIIGFTGCFDLIGESLGSLIGGYVFESYGGVSSFRFFAYGSALMCFLNIVCNSFGLTKEIKRHDFTAVSTNINME